MKNRVLEDIKNYAKERLQQAYGFVGVAEGETMAMLNTTDNLENNIVIKIEVKEE